MRLLAATLVILVLGGASQASADTSPQHWDDQRIGFWADICFATIPDFKGAESRASRLGFERQSNGYFVYKEDDAVVSFKRSGKCGCMISFSVKKSGYAAEKIMQRLVNLGSRFDASSSPKIVGYIKSESGPLRVVLLSKKESGLDWVGVDITGQKSCPL